MANTLTYKDTTFNIGDSVSVGYKIKEGDKFRIQEFAGIITQVKGTLENKNITIRKEGAMGIGVERIIPLNSPFIDGIKLLRKTKYTKAKIPFLKLLSTKETNRKLFRSDADQLKIDANKKAQSAKKATKKVIKKEDSTEKTQ